MPRLAEPTWSRSTSRAPSGRYSPTRVSPRSGPPQSCSSTTGHNCPTGAPSPGRAASDAFAEAGYSTEITFPNPNPADEFEGHGTLWA